MKDVENLSKKKDINGNTIETTFINIPVEQGDTLVFDLENTAEITDEDKKSNIYYLNFKTSKKDAEKRFLIGDIVYSSFVNKKGEIEENGNYRMPKGKKPSSFFKCEEVAKTMDDPFIQKFRAAFREKADEIEKLLKSYPSVVLHFDFGGKRWIDFEGTIDNIDSILTDSLVINTSFENKVALDKYLYKTLGGATPGFSEESRYKNRLFSRDEIISLMYAGKAAESPTIRINPTNIGIIAIPHSDNLNSSEVVRFFERNNSYLNDEEVDIEQGKEGEMSSRADGDNESLFAELVENNFDAKVKYDLVFTNIPKSPAGVFWDLTEIANLEKSLLVNINEKIRNIKHEVNSWAYSEIPNLKSKPVFDTKISFLKILGDVTKDKKKFQNHLLSVLPKIYTDTYYHDPIILPAFIERVEYNIRNSGQGFSTLKYDFYFLIRLQKTDIMAEITNSKSYTIGQALGTMARPFAAWRDDCPIKSFEKSYVGNLTRRISSLDDVTKFSDFLNQKLTIHERAFKAEKEAFLSLAETLKNFEGEKYNKHYCSLGFFESYYAPYKKPEKDTETIAEND
ncbi:hypothetical protein [Cruoricaptor ignavus]|nr:hypothetical protein [Cruoricaptor ignavus]